MKKFIVLMLGIFLLAACMAVPEVAPTQGVFAPVANGLVSLPDDARDLVLALVTGGIAFLLVRINMGQFTQPIAAAVSPLIVALIEMGLGTIPSVYDSILLAILHWLVLFISGSIGAFVLAMRIRTPKTIMSG